MALIKEDDLPPFKRQIGRISSIYSGRDGVVRVATVRTASGEYKRASRLCVLPLDNSSSELCRRKKLLVFEVLILKEASLSTPIEISIFIFVKE